MQLKSVLSVAAACVVSAGAANANMLFDFYVGASAGLGANVAFVDGDHSSHAAQSYGALAGVDIPFVRIEAEYNYLTRGDDNMQLAFADLYLKMPTPIIKPYIGGGVGALFAGDVSGADIDTTIAYQGMVGVTIDVPVLPLDVDIEGRALYIPDAFDIAGTTPDILQYEGRIKLRYVF